MNRKYVIFIFMLSLVFTKTLDNNIKKTNNSTTNTFNNNNNNNDDSLNKNLRPIESNNITDKTIHDGADLILWPFKLFYNSVNLLYKVIKIIKKKIYNNTKIIYKKLQKNPLELLIILFLILITLLSFLLISKFQNKIIFNSIIFIITCILMSFFKVNESIIHYITNYIFFYILLYINLKNLIKQFKIKIPYLFTIYSIWHFGSLCNSGLINELPCIERLKFLKILSIIFFFTLLLAFKKLNNSEKINKIYYIYITVLSTVFLYFNTSPFSLILLLMIIISLLIILAIKKLLTTENKNYILTVTLYENKNYIINFTLFIMLFTQIFYTYIVHFFSLHIPFPTWYKAILFLLFSCFSMFLIDQYVQNYINKKLNFNNEHSITSRIISISSIIRKLIQILSLILILIQITVILKYNITSILNLLGFLSFGLSFGVQSLVKDFVSGFFILSENLINIGDKVKINNNTGVIQNIFLRNIKILNQESNSIIIIPFGSINVIENFSHNCIFISFVIKNSIASDEIHDIIEDSTNKITSKYNKINIQTQIAQNTQNIQVSLIIKNINSKNQANIENILKESFGFKKIEIFYI